MKKYIGFLIVLSIFVLGGSKAQAEVNPNNTPCASTATPSITILSPNGGEIYTVGQQIPVKWISCNIPATATIVPVFVYEDSKDTNEERHNSGAQSLDHVLNSGNTTITPPSSFLNILGKHFKIGLVNNSALYATDTTNMQTRDYSDDTFTITYSSISPFGCVTNGNTTVCPSKPPVCPSGCDCSGANTSCPVVPIVDNSCLPGYKYSPKTGQLCTGEIINDGCLPGYKFSPITGQMCKISSTIPATPVYPSGCITNGDTTVCPSKPISIYPAGCNSSNGFSSVTGIDCSGACSLSGAGVNCTTGEVTNEISISKPLSRILKIGVKGEDVKLIQELLGLKADGIFGNMTANKVKEWQKTNGLNSDGVFGPASFQKINSN